MKNKKTNHLEKIIYIYSAQPKQHENNKRKWSGTKCLQAHLRCNGTNRARKEDHIYLLGYIPCPFFINEINQYLFTFNKRAKSSLCEISQR